jgi:hypothetical protein
MAQYVFAKYNRSFPMPQLHCYVPESIAQQVQQHAAQVGLSLSAYLAELVKRDVGAGWPEGFEAALFGTGANGSPLVVESAGPAQERLALL